MARESVHGWQYRIVWSDTIERLLVESFGANMILFEA
jgi:hypothetical protein